MSGGAGTEVRHPLVKRRGSPAGSLVGVLGVFTVSVCGCIAPVLTPRAEDASAPGDFYKSLNPGAAKCTPSVPILHEHEIGAREYRELSQLSASCSPAAPAVCRRTLGERACELKADALILSDGPEGGPTPLGASTQSEISLGGRAVVWK